MKIDRIKLTDINSVYPHRIATSLSLVPLTAVFRRMIESSQEQENVLPRLVLDQFETHLAKYGDLRSESLEQCQSIFDLLFSFHKGHRDKSLYWGILDPGVTLTLCGTQDFFSILSGMMKQEQFLEFQEWRIRSLYALILERFYDYPTNMEQSFVYMEPETSETFRNHYSWTIDFTYVHVRLISDSLPTLNYQEITKQKEIKNSKLDALQSFLPLSHFQFDGFSILNAEDVSERVEIERIKEFKFNVSSTGSKQVYLELLHTIQSVFRSKDVKFSLIPVFGQKNLQTLMLDEIAEHSVFFNIEKYVCADRFQAYKESPKIILYQVLGMLSNSDADFAALMQGKGVGSYVCFPLFYKNNLTGIFEVYTEKSTQLDERVLVKLRNISDMLAQLMYEVSLEFNNRINSVIIDKFTVIQPAVEWKFKEAAVKYIQEQDILELDNVQIADIVLDNVIPLYGAIDIRNSTVARNDAIVKDMEVYLDALDVLIAALTADLSFMKNEEIQHATAYWREKLASGYLEQVFVRLMDFCNKDVPRFLEFFRTTCIKSEPHVQRFEQIVDRQQGVAYLHRRKLEDSIQNLNRVISGELDILHDTINERVACYFDKFRTDGIEFDVYLGKSISPARTFRPEDIKAARYEQLKSMIVIARKTHALKEDLPYALDTTYLIYVNSSEIDVGFRSDERRFDVEGSYNIRYQVIKKRIDKITIKGSYERLTQPYQIAIVYLSEETYEEYMDFVRILRNEGIITSPIESLDLEDVQGISGLKAIRFNTLA